MEGGKEGKGEEEKLGVRMPGYAFGVAGGMLLGNWVQRWMSEG